MEALYTVPVTYQVYIYIYFIIYHYSMGVVWKWYRENPYRSGMGNVSQWYGSGMEVV